jgi:UDP-glucose 4-epimerase
MNIAKALLTYPQVEKIVGIDVNTPPDMPQRLVFIKRDVREPMLGLLTDHQIDTVIHAAYVLPPIHDKELMEDINMGGTRNTLNASAEAGIGHLLYTSSTTAYGFHPDNPVPLTEESPLRGNDDFTYSKNKKEIELLMKGFIEQHPEMTVTILRPCFVVGPGFANPLARHLRKPFVLLPTKTAPFQFVHEDDLIRVIVMCLTETIGGVFNVTGEGTMEFGEMVKKLGNRAIRLPFGLLYVLNNLAWFMRMHFLAEGPSSGLNLIRYPWLASSERLLRETGFEFEHDTRSAFDDFVKHVIR